MATHTSPTLVQMKQIICHHLEIDANASLNSIVFDASNLLGIEDSTDETRPLVQRIKHIIAVLGINNGERMPSFSPAPTSTPVHTHEKNSAGLFNVGLSKQDTSLFSTDHVLDLFTTSLFYQIVKPSKDGFLPTGLVICIIFVLFILAKDNKDTMKRLGRALCLNVDEPGYEQAVEKMLHWIPDMLRPFDEHLFFSVGIEPVLTNMELAWVCSSFQNWDVVNRAVERVCGYAPISKQPDGIVIGIGAFLERLFVTGGFQENIQWGIDVRNVFVGAHVRGSFRYVQSKENQKGAVILPLISPPGQNDYVLLVDADMMQKHGIAEISRRLRASPAANVVIRYPVARLGLDARIDDHLGISGIKVDSVSSELSEMRVCADMQLTPHGLIMRAMVRVSLTRGTRPPEIVFDGPFFVFLFTSGQGTQEICSGIGYVGTAESFINI